jgi:predicted N-formylglutamate amidohydrolase
MTGLLAPDEPPPFTIVNPTAASPWVITCDHASNRVPRALGTLGVTDEERARHIGWDIGAAAVTRRLAAHLDAWAILTSYSRLVIDCNRRPDVPSSIPTRSENTDITGNIGMIEDAAILRRSTLFDPYHAAIAEELDRRAAAAACKTIFVAMHSFTPVYDGVARPMHAGVLYNRDARLARALLADLRNEPGLVIGDNTPYSVSDESDYGIPVHGERRGLPHVELEVRQDLIASAAGQEEWAERLARLLVKAAAAIGALPA